ncbi:hypothetical protein [Nocardioides sambongensis]|uniref:hypothetical protein n=1 Tax=Nocardioides sambongensis TaxID=2589074 RepID=UPI00112B4DFB|nr:hypothetical protein [Nocardioides sambongensis]
MSDYWTDWGQNRRLAEAEAALSNERHARSLLAAQMRRQQGDLQAQLDRLTRAFVALLEHEDIRAELSQHTGAADTRRYAGDVVASVIVTGNGPTHQVSVPPDVPGYWLAAATAALATATGAGPGPTGADLLEEARRRDARRTSSLLTLVDLQARRVEWSRGRLGEALALGTEASVLQRQLWLGIAEERLDADAVSTLAASLSAALDAVPAADVDAALVAALSGPTGPRTSEYDAQVLRLRALAGCLRGEGAGDRRSAPTRGRDTPAETDEGSVEQSEDPLATCTLALIGQGSPAEADILTRMAEVRGELGYDDSATRRIDVDAPAGTVADLLVGDLTRSTPTPGSGAHGVALRVLTPALLRVTDQLEAEATRPAPRSVDVRFRDDAVTVTPSGADDGTWRERAARTIPDRSVRWTAPTAAACLVVAVVCGGLGFGNGAWFLLAALALGAAGGVLYTRSSIRQDVAASRRHAVARWEREIDRTAEQLRSTQETQAAAATSAVSTAAAIRGVLAPRVGEPARG